MNQQVASHGRSAIIRTQGRGRYQPGNGLDDFVPDPAKVGCLGEELRACEAP